MIKVNYSNSQRAGVIFLPNTIILRLLLLSKDAPEIQSQGKLHMAHPNGRNAKLNGRLPFDY